MPAAQVPGVEGLESNNCTQHHLKQIFRLLCVQPTAAHSTQRVPHTQAVC
jgi:hypothetical protein